jgi:NAD(P)-dependent dehydrogenase (short-subunit alcohol dehydrogenase family)
MQVEDKTCDEDGRFRGGPTSIVEAGNVTVQIVFNFRYTRGDDGPNINILGVLFSYATELHQNLKELRAQGDTMKKLDGKVAVITGATSGIGLASAKLFVAEGAYVFITGRRQKELDEAVKAIGINVTGVRGDASNLADLDRLYETVKTGKGQLDILFANAGVGEFNVRLGSVTEANFDQTFNVNVRGTLFTVQKALPLMRDGGSIIMTGSIASVKGFEGVSVYNASKAAIRSFARTWTLDLKARKIRVNVLSPGTIDTGIFVGVPKEVKDQFVSLIPMGRIGEPAEIATAALFLASNDSSFVTGIELFVDGGTAQI